MNIIPDSKNSYAAFEITAQDDRKHLIIKPVLFWRIAEDGTVCGYVLHPHDSKVVVSVQDCEAPHIKFKGFSSKN